MSEAKSEIFEANSEIFEAKSEIFEAKSEISEAKSGIFEAKSGIFEANPRFSKQNPRFSKQNARNRTPELRNPLKIHAKSIPNLVKIPYFHIFLAAYYKSFPVLRLLWKKTFFWRSPPSLELPEREKKCARNGIPRIQK